MKYLSGAIATATVDAVLASTLLNNAGLATIPFNRLLVNDSLFRFDAVPLEAEAKTVCAQLG